MYLSKSPYIIKKYYQDLVWNSPNRMRKIYLTFDDGPTPEITNYVLDLLTKYKAKATFFCIGDNAKKYPAVMQQIVNEGHTIGNHTMHHLNGWKTDDGIYLSNIKEAQQYINSTLFRPPYGRIKNHS